MKKALLTCFVSLLVLPQISFGQKVYFSDTTNYWKTEWTMGGGPDGEPIQHIHDDYSFADTLVGWNGHAYSKLNGLLIRDDTNARVVYIKPLTSALGSFRVMDTVNEFIYMDYRLQAGDTFHIPILYSDDSVNIHIVTATDSIFFNNFWHKRIYITLHRFVESQSLWFWATEDYQIIEGVGNLHGPIMKIKNGDEYEAPRLICFRNQGIFPYNLYSQCYDPISINETNNPTNNLELSPNPASNSFRLKYTGQNAGELQLNITDMAGRHQLKTTFKGQATVDISTFPPGIYFARVSQNGMLLQTKKLIVTR